MTYMIDYDLRQPGRNYASLIAAIQALGAWAHPLKSTWLVASRMSTVEVRDALAKHIDGNDGLLVVQVASEAAWLGIAPDVSQWIRSRLGAVTA